MPLRLSFFFFFLFHFLSTLSTLLFYSFLTLSKLTVTSGDHFLPSDDITVGTSVTSGACLQIPTADALEPVHQDGGVEEDNQNTGMHELDRQVKETPIGEEESSVTGELGTKVVDELEAAGEKDKEVVSDDSSQPVCDEENSMGEDYQKVEFAVLYWHKSTGYYYDPVSSSVSNNR